MKLEKRNGVWCLGPTELWTGSKDEIHPTEITGPECQARTFGEWHHRRCHNPSKFEVGGLKFCGVHHPERVQKKLDKRRAAFEHKMKTNHLNYAVVDARRAIAEAAIDHVHQRVPFDDVVSAVDEFERLSAELEEHKKGGE